MNKRQYNKKYYLNNRNKILQHRKLFRKSHKKDFRDIDKLNYLKNREKILQKRIRYRKINREQIKTYMSIYRKKNKKKLQVQHMKYILNRLKTNIEYKIECNLRSRLYQVLKKINKSESTMKLVGCSIKFFKNYYESKFTKGMSWEKVMNGEIHCDHIIPCASFDLIKPSEQKKCFHYTNLQPLWAKDNLQKSKKLKII